ncbi:hypothetical protein V8E53_009330 [Lactarius tabidus]
MVHDKKWVTGLLNEGDIYWQMRARTSEVSLTALNMCAGAGGVVSNPHLLAARERYLTIDIKTSQADDHVPYLKALLSEKKCDTTAEVVAWLCHLINRDICCPPSLLAVLWECVLDPGNLLLDDLKAKIVGLVSQRLTLPTDFSEDARSRFASLLPESEVDDPEKHPSFCLTASDLSREVVHILFPYATPSLSGTLSQLAIQEWAHSETLRMFAPSARLEFRWHNLVCLALANTRSHTHIQTTIPSLRTINTPQVSAVDFKFVSILALVKRIISHGSSTDLRSSVRELWTSWADIANNDSHAHRTLVRPIVGTFFRLAALTCDASLVRSCVRLASVWFWQFDLGDDVARRQAQLFAVEYPVAAAVSGDSLWERMPVAMELPPHYTFPQWISILLSKTILHLVRLDAQRTVDIYHLWQRYLPVPDLSGPMGPMLVQEGELTTSARRHVAWALLALVCSAQARTAVTIFKNVHARDPGFFNCRVTRAFLSMLLRHRQFRGAAEIAKLSPRAMLEAFCALGPTPPGLNPLRRSPTGRVLTTEMACRRRRAYTVGSETAFCVSFASLGYAEVLVCARGAGLATRAYRLARTLRNAGEQTAFGNIILDGQVTHAKSQGSWHSSAVLRTLRLLVEEHGFVPDRVTTNIIDKAVLVSPTSLTGHDAHVVPFGSSEAAMRETAAVLGTGTPAAKSKLSFARHVKPLHKMFIKALFLRKDVADARRVVGILKEGERADVERIARRGKSRLRP